MEAGGGDKSYDDGCSASPTSSPPHSPPCPQSIFAGRLPGAAASFYPIIPYKYIIFTLLCLCFYPPPQSLTRLFSFFSLISFWYCAAVCLSAELLRRHRLVLMFYMIITTAAAAAGVIVMMMMTPATTVTRHRGSDGHKHSRWRIRRLNGKWRRKERRLSWQQAGLEWTGSPTLLPPPPLEELRLIR